MKRTFAKYLRSLALAAWLFMLLGQNYSPAQAAPARRPLPKLNTKRGLYIRPDGTRVYKDPLPAKKRVFTYKRRDGKVVHKVVGPRRAYGSKPRAVRRPAKTKRSSTKRSSTKRSSTKRSSSRRR